MYQPTSADDPLGVYLLARRITPGPAVVTGTPPPVPQPSGVYPPDAVF
jgi:hypothetical protein